MELSLPRFLRHIPNRRSFIPIPPFRHSTAAATLSPNKNPTSLKRSGPSYFASPWPRASTSSDETNTSTSNHFEKVSINTNFHSERAPDEAVDTDSQSGKVHDEAIGAEAQVQVEPDESINAGETFASVSDEVIATEEYSTATPEAAQTQAIELLDGVIATEEYSTATPKAAQTQAIELLDGVNFVQSHEVIATEEYSTATAEAAQAQAIELLDGVNFVQSDEVITTEEYSTATPEAAQTQAIELLDGVNLDYGDSFSIVINGSGVLVALSILSAIVGAIDSIPLFPKVLEIIGLAYTVWFSYRYLIFKKNRDELSVKIEELKKQIIGSTSD